MQNYAENFAKHIERQGKRFKAEKAPTRHILLAIQDSGPRLSTLLALVRGHEYKIV